MADRFLTLQIPVPASVVATPSAPWAKVADGIWGLRLTTGKTDFVGITEILGTPDTYGADQANPIESFIGWTAATGYAYDSVSSAYQHTAGASTPLVKRLTSTVGDVIQVNYGVFGCTAGSVSFRLGLDEIDYQTASGSTRFTPSFSAPNLVVIPTGDFDGTVVVTARKVTPGSSVPFPAPITYRAHYLPRGNWCDSWEDALDLETGGDWEQLRAHTFRLADQMADGTRMSAYLAGLGLGLEGAWISLIASGLMAYANMPGQYDGTGSDRDTIPLWSGRVRSVMPSMTRLELACESPSDADDLGIQANDSQIQPIAYGQCHKLSLPQFNQSNIAPQNYNLQSSEIVVGPLIPSVQIAKEDVNSLTKFALGSANSAGLVAYGQGPYGQAPTSLEHYARLELFGSFPDLSQWFSPTASPWDPGYTQAYLVPEDAFGWYLECTSGKGVGNVRRIKPGSTIIVRIDNDGILNPTWPVAADDNYGDDMFIHTPRGYITYSRYASFIQFTLDAPMTDLETGDNVFQDAVSLDDAVSVAARIPMTGSDNTQQIGFWKFDRSYFRIVNKGFQFSLPVGADNSAADLFVFQDNGDGVTNQSDYVLIDNANTLVEISGNKIFLIPPADSFANMRVFSKLDADVSKIFMVNNPASTGLAHLTSAYVKTLLDSGVHLNLSFMINSALASHNEWDVDSHFAIFLANPGWNLSGIDKIILCVEMNANTTFAAAVESRLWQGLQVFRNASNDLWYMPFLPSGDDPTHRYRAANSQVFPSSAPLGVSINSLPPSVESSSSSDWLKNAVQLPIPSGFSSDIAAVCIFIGASHAHGGNTNVVDMALNRLALYASRTVSISKIFADISGPAYATDALWTPTRLAALANGLTGTDVIADHAHAVEDLERRWVHRPFRGVYGDTWDVADTASVEQSCTDLWTKTQPGLVPLAAASRPKISYAISQNGIQAGDALAQFCRDGMLAGCRDGWGRVQVHAFLARTGLAEQDAIILESDLVHRSISQAPSTDVGRVVTAPLIRFNQVAGAPIFYVQVTHPQASTFDPSYAIGFSSAAQAQRAWTACHRGYMSTGAVNAREIRMESVYGQADFEALTLQPRGTTFFDWLARPKITLTPTVRLDHPASMLGRGARVKIVHRLFAPGGQWGIVASRKPDPSKDLCTLSVIMDLPA